MNMFVYGCENNRDPSRRLKERVFPRLLAENNSSFSFDGCNFAVQKSKEATARVVMWRELGLLNRLAVHDCMLRNHGLYSGCVCSLMALRSFTLEASLCGCTIGKRAGLQFTPQHFEEVGRSLCDTLLDYCDPDQSKVDVLF
jgi:hypothetical protein